MSESIDKHLERYLGPIGRGWATRGKVDGEDVAGVHVCLFEDRPVQGVVTYATLGLSRHVLHMTTSGREVRQELLLSVAASFEEDSFVDLLSYVAEEVLRDHHALLAGQVLPLGHAVSRRSDCNSLYISLPVVFPAELATCSDTDPPTVFAWLIPIHPAEAALVNQAGWNEFEDRLERSDPDLFDLERPPIV